MQVKVYTIQSKKKNLGMSIKIAKIKHMPLKITIIVFGQEETLTVFSKTHPM